MRKKKEILFLCQFFYPEYVSSATLPYDTALALKKAGFEVAALCGYPHEYANGEECPLRQTVNGMDIHRVKYLQMDRKGILGRLVNYFSFTFMMLLHLFEIGRYQTVIVYSNPPILPWVAYMAKRIFGTKLVFVAYDLYPEIATTTNALREGSIVCRLMDYINRCVYHRADRVVALSSEMKEYIVANRPISSDRVAVIPNWYADLGEPERNLPDNQFKNVTNGRFVVSYFGNMGTAQDMQTILDAIRQMKDDEKVCFLFAGHGNKIEKIRNTITEEEINNVYIYDFLRGKDFQDALAISDCALVSLETGLTGLCVPSKTYSYMAQGIPLLAIMDMSDIVSDIEEGAGKWVRNGDSNGLVERIRFMMSNPEEHQLMRKVCRQIYKNKYTTQVCTEKYIHVMRQM